MVLSAGETQALQLAIAVHKINPGLKLDEFSLLFRCDHKNHLYLLVTLSRVPVPGSYVVLG